MKSILALEGPSYSGKTTLLNELSKRFPKGTLLSIPEYVEFAGGPDSIPTTPAETIEEELRSLEFFLKIDRQRWSWATRQEPAACIAVLDRSFHTLLAYRYAIAPRFGSAELFELACDVADTFDKVQPDHIFYLDVGHVELTQRWSRRDDACAPIFKDQEFNVRFREYFFPTTNYYKKAVQRLDGTLVTGLLAEIVEEAITP